MVLHWILFHLVNDLFDCWRVFVKSKKSDLSVGDYLFLGAIFMVYGSMFAYFLCCLLPSYVLTFRFVL